MTVGRLFLAQSRTTCYQSYRFMRSITTLRNKALYCVVSYQHSDSIAIIEIIEIDWPAPGFLYLSSWTRVTRTQRDACKPNWASSDAIFNRQMLIRMEIRAAGLALWWQLGLLGLYLNEAHLHDHPCVNLLLLPPILPLPAWALAP